MKLSLKNIVGFGGKLYIVEYFAVITFRAFFQNLRHESTKKGNGKLRCTEKKKKQPKQKYFCP